MKTENKTTKPLEDDTSVFGYLKISISEKIMAKVMYALIISKGKLVNSNHLSLEQYSRKQNAGNVVDIVVELKQNKVKLFEELSEISIKSSDEFQGKLKFN